MHTPQRVEQMLRRTGGKVVQVEGLPSTWGHLDIADVAELNERLPNGVQGVKNTLTVATGIWATTLRGDTQVTVDGRAYIVRHGERLDDGGTTAYYLARG